MRINGSYIARDGGNLHFILNPLSRGYSQDFKAIATKKWPEASFLFSSDETELFDFGRKAAKPRQGMPPVVVACGGDGTFRAVATAVGSSAILGIVPMGTVNIVASQLGIPTDIRSALELLAKGHPASIYPGCCSWNGPNDCRLFFVSVSAGTDAEAVHFVSRRLKMVLGEKAYALSFISRLLFHPLPKVTYRTDGKRFFTNGLIVAASGFYGGRHAITARQSLFKPGIEIIKLRPGRKNILGFFIALFFRMGKCSDFASFDSRTQIEILCRPHGRFQIDGDSLSASKINIRSLDMPLAVIAIRASG